jgi:hypothetical protein
MRRQGLEQARIVDIEEAPIMPLFHKPKRRFHLRRISRWHDTAAAWGNERVVSRSSD